MNFLTNKSTGKPYPLGSGWSKKAKFNKENVATVPDATGVYLFYNSGGTPIYIGRTIDRDFSGLRHRLQSYYEKDDFGEHETKKVLRPHIDSFSWKKTTEPQAREIEMKLKQQMRFNADNKMNEEKKHHVSS